MSTLGEVTFEDIQPRGKPLPDGVYRATVLEASVQPYTGRDKSGNETRGSRLVRTYGNLRTVEGNSELTLPNGDTFKFGNRKLFARDWIDHTDEQATLIGNRNIKTEAISAGIIKKPVRGEPPVPFDWADRMPEYVGVLVGKEVIVVTKQRVREKNGEVVKEDDGVTPVIDANIVGYRTAA